jgi:putative ABC transport system permease protein
MMFAELLISAELGLIYGIVALGIYITFKVIDFQDLTCDGSFVLGATTSTMMLYNGYGPGIALIAGMIAGACAGLMTALLATLGKVPQLLAGIIVAFMLYSVNCAIMKGIPNRTIAEETTIFYAWNSSLILIVIAALCWVVLSYLLITEWGLALRSIGFNKRLAMNMGINVTVFTCVGMTISNGLIGLAGGLLSQYQGFADISQGTGTLIIGLAAVIVGRALITHGFLWRATAACIIGSVVYRTILGCALHSTTIGLPSYALNGITGLILLIILMSTRGRTC